MLGRATRRLFVSAAPPIVVAALSGCIADGGGSTPSDNPAVGDAEQMGDLRLGSPAFEDGGSIPDEYGREARNVNPPLTIEGVPSDAASLALIVDDPDAGEEAFLHWLVWNVPPGETEIPEDWTPTEAIEGTNDFGTRGYGGPDPPGEPHTYRFKLYALDTELDLPTDAGIRDAGEAMRDHLLARTQLEGTYAP